MPSLRFPTFKNQVNTFDRTDINPLPSVELNSLKTTPNENVFFLFCPRDVDDFGYLGDTRIDGKRLIAGSKNVRIYRAIPYEYCFAAMKTKRQKKKDKCRVDNTNGSNGFKSHSRLVCRAPLLSRIFVIIPAVVPPDRETRPLSSTFRATRTCSGCLSSVLLRDTILIIFRQLPGSSISMVLVIRYTKYFRVDCVEDGVFHAVCFTEHSRTSDERKTSEMGYPGGNNTFFALPPISTKCVDLSIYRY